MQSLVLSWLLCAFVVCGASQTIVPTSSSSSFPGCALSCGVLLGAQTACIPPYTAVTSQLAYDNCFCQYSTVQPLYASADGICTTECSLESDRRLLQTWFTGFCGQVIKGVDPVSATATSGATATSSQTGSVITLSSVPSSGNKSDNGPTWFSTHWKWVVMVIVLFIGFIVIAVVGVWLKRRHKRKSQEKIARRSGFPIVESKGDGPQPIGATPDLWGPHQHMAASHGYKYPRKDAIGAGVIPRQSSDRNYVSKSGGEDVNIDEIKNEDSILPAFSQGSRPRPSDLDADLRAAERQRRRDGRKRGQEKNRRRDRLVEQGLRGIRPKNDHSSET